MSLSEDRGPDGSENELITVLQRSTFRYFDDYANHANGLVRDNSRTDAPASIAGSGLALGCFIVAAERDWLPRAELARRARALLDFFWNAEQSESPTATGYRGFFYHFLDFHSGQRVQRSELSTIDSAIVFAGALAAAEYFDGNTEDECAIRRLALDIYQRADWQWATHNRPAITHGWTPERGFLPYDWRGYNEALFLHILALGSPSSRADDGAYDEWLSGYRWKSIYGIEYLHGGPLFMHQLGHVWIDFRGIQDRFMRGRAIDYFENSRRATYIQREYARRNPRRLRGYDENTWGVTASDGPGPATKTVGGRRRRFYDYIARGVPYGPDDGTLAPWSVAASLPFAPEIVLPALANIERNYPAITSDHGYKCSFNPTFGENDGSSWISRGYYALDQGPVVIMIENFRSGLVWRVLRSSPFVRAGLARAGFRGGWLG